MTAKKRIPFNQLIQRLKENYSITSGRFITPSHKFVGHSAYCLGTTDSPYGYLIHNPDEASLFRDGKYPLLVFFHGGGEFGVSSSNNAVVLCDDVGSSPKLIPQLSHIRYT